MTRKTAQRWIDLALWDAISSALARTGCKFPHRYVWISRRKLRTKHIKVITVQFFETDKEIPTEVYSVFLFKKNPLVGLVTLPGSFTIHDLN